MSDTLLYFKKKKLPPYDQLESTRSLLDRIEESINLNNVRNIFFNSNFTEVVVWYFG